MRILITLLLALSCAVPAIAATYDVGHGTITAPEDFVFKHTGTKDSFMGTLTRKSDGFVITFDIGMMAGTRMHEGKKEKCEFFRKHRVGTLSATTGIEAVEGVRQIATTVDYDPKTKRDPANFWAVIRKDTDIADFLLVVMTYHPDLP